VGELAMWSIILDRTNYPPGGHGQGHVTRFNILDYIKYLWTG